VTRSDVLQRIQTILKAVVPSGVEVRVDSRLRTDLGIDSLTAVEVLLYVEREFRIRLDDDSIYEVRTVSDVVELVSKELMNSGQMEGV